MPVNRYFNQTTFQPEQDLIQDLIDESIAIYGHEVYYIPRDTVNLDAFFGEDPAAQFTDAYPIEMYLKTVESFQGQSEFITKFGLHIEDQATFVVSTRRFDEAVLLKNADRVALHGADVLVRPRENDLIYIQMTPNNRYLFEIRFVENKEQLFQLGKLYTYELRCEMMNFSNEKVQTDIPAVDGVIDTQTYVIPMNLQVGGSGTFIDNESVYQGDSFAAATAKGLVHEWFPDTRVLHVKFPIGYFAQNTAIRGVTSNAVWITADTAIDPAPVEHDPISDNQLLHNNPENVIVSRGTHTLLD